MAVFDRTSKEVSGKTYYLDRDFGSGVRSYARLMVKDSTGTEIAIYDETFEYNFRQVAMWVAIVSFVGFVFYSIAKHIKESES